MRGVFFRCSLVFQPFGYCFAFPIGCISNTEVRANRRLPEPENNRKYRPRIRRKWRQRRGRHPRNDNFIPAQRYSKTLLFLINTDLYTQHAKLSGRVFTPGIFLLYTGSVNFSVHLTSNMCPSYRRLSPFS